MTPRSTLGLLSLAIWPAIGIAQTAFEVAAISQASPGTFRSPGFPLDAGDAYAQTNGRFSAIAPLSAYITFAYKLTLTSDQRQTMLSRLPAWVETDRFEIQAKAPIDNPSKDQLRLMLQTLLTTRFQLAVHYESKVIPVFFLVRAKQAGPQLRPHAGGPPCDQAPSRDVFPPICGATMMQSRPNGVRAGTRDVTLEQLAASLPGFGKLDRPVVDRTGLTGRFDYTLEWASSSGLGVIPNRDPQAAAEDESNFMRALEEQLGLKLESTRAPVQTLVVDRVEKPSAN